MKNWKTFVASLLLTSLSMASIYSQTAPSKAVNLSLQTSAGNHGLNANIGARLQLVPNLAIDIEVGHTSWRHRNSENYRVNTGIRSQDISISGGGGFGIDAIAFARPNHTGFYAGAGFRTHSYTILSEYRIEPDNDPLFNGSGGFFGALVDVTIELLDGQRASFEDRGTLTAVNLRSGYCLEFKDGSRFDMGVTLLSRQTGQLTYQRPGRDNIYNGVKTDLDEEFRNPISISAEVKYIVPLF